MTLRPRRLLFTAVAGLLGVGMTAVALDAYAADEAPAGEPIVFVVDGVERCVDIPAGHLRERSRLQLWDCTGGANQRFTFDTGRRLLRSATGNCVAGPVTGRRMHSVLVQEPCPPADRSADPERFTWVPTSACRTGDTIGRCDPPQRALYGVDRKPNFVLGVVATDRTGAPNGAPLEVTFVNERSADPRGLMYPASGPGLGLP